MDRDIIMYKLNHYRILGHANNFFHILLQFKIAVYLYRGSILGWFYFLSIKWYATFYAKRLRLFSDDTALVMNISNTDTLNADVNRKLKVVREWCTCNKLAMNDTKTFFFKFQMKNKHVPKFARKLWLLWADCECSQGQLLKFGNE